MTLDECIPNVTRVRCPGGATGIVSKVMPTYRATGRPCKWPVAVKLDGTNTERTFAPEELTKIVPSSVMGVPYP